MIYLSEVEVAERLHLGRRTLQRWRTTGEGPQWCRLGQRRIVYRDADIDAWAAKHLYAHRADELSRASAA